MCYGDYVLEDGQVIGDESHTGQGMMQGWIDVKRTNSWMKECGLLDFADWLFSLWIGSYWDGNNWKIVVVEE